MGGDLAGLELPKKYQMSTREANQAVKDLMASEGLSSERARQALSWRTCENILKDSANAIADEGRVEFQDSSGKLTGGESGLMDLVDRSLRAEAGGTLGKNRLPVPVVPYRETPMTAKAGELRSQSGSIYIPNIGEGRIGYGARKAIERLNSERQKIAAYWSAGQVRDALARTKDVAGTEAKIYARQNANDFRGELARTYGKDAGLAEDALTFAVEARNGPEDRPTGSRRETGHLRHPCARRHALQTPRIKGS